MKKKKNVASIKSRIPKNSLKNCPGKVLKYLNNDPFFTCPYLLLHLVFIFIFYLILVANSKWPIYLAKLRGTVPYPDAQM